MPEFTDSYEVGGVFVFDQLSLNTSVYHRYTTDKVERVSTFDDGVTTWIPLNIGTNKATGAEVNFKYSPSRKITFNGDVNYNVFDRDGTFDGQDFDFSADQWSGKLTAKYKISRALDAEVTSQYLSREQTIQGIQSANLFADFGLRYKILNGKGVFNFSVRDIFKSRFQENTIQNDEFSIYSWNRRGRFVTLGFSYGFGKGEAMQYSGQRRR
jgi:outer membrane receptor for ferrienterochelin and colicin